MYIQYVTSYCRSLRPVICAALIAHFIPDHAGTSSAALRDHLMSKGLQPETAVTTENHSRTIVRGTGVVSALTLLSRLLGFVRDVLVARLFGASYIADAFFVAFRIPNLLRSFVAEGALTSAFVPVFSGELRAGSDRAQAALSSVGTLLFIATALLSLVGILGAETIVTLFAPGFVADPAKLDLCIMLTQIMFPFIVCVSFVAMLNGALNSARIFGAAAWAQVWMNLALIVGALIAGYSAERNAAIMLAFSVIVGGLIQIVVQIPALRRAGFRLRPTTAVFTPPVREVLRLMIPATIGAAVYQISIFLNTLLASLLEPGSVSWLFYADRLTQLPIGVFTVSLASVVLPTLASAEAAGDRAAFGQNLVNSLRYTSFVIIPLSVGTCVLAEPLIRLMFERGAFSAESSLRTAQAVQTLAVGLWGASCHSMVVRAFMAEKDPRTPTVISLGALILGFALAIVFMGPLYLPADGVAATVIASLQSRLAGSGLGLTLGHAGLGLASSITSTFAFVVLAMIMHRRRVGLAWRPFLSATACSILASIAMAGVIIGCGLRDLAPLPAVVGGTILGGVTFLAVAWALGMREVREAIALVQSFITRGLGSGGTKSA